MEGSPTAYCLLPTPSGFNQARICCPWKGLQLPTAYCLLPTAYSLGLQWGHDVSRGRRSLASDQTALLPASMGPRSGVVEDASQGRM